MFWLRDVSDVPNPNRKENTVMRKIRITFAALLVGAAAATAVPAPGPGSAAVTPTVQAPTPTPERSPGNKSWALVLEPQAEAPTV